MLKNCLHRVADFLKGRPESEKLLILSLAVGVVSGLAAVILETLAHSIKHTLTSWFHGELDNVLFLVYPG